MKYFIPLLFLASPVMAQEAVEVSPSRFEACLAEVRTSGGDAFAARLLHTRGGCCGEDRAETDIHWCTPERMDIYLQR